MNATFPQAASHEPQAVARSAWLDLGSGPQPYPGYTGVDYGCEPAPGAVVLHCDLWDGQAWPFEDDSIEGLRAWHVIEHIPHARIVIGTGEAKVTRRSPGKAPVILHQPYPISQDAFFWFFDQAFRVAKSGCQFKLAWPHPNHDHADQDPTHCRRIPPSTLHYLSIAGRRTLRVHHYPTVCDWHVETVTCIGDDKALSKFESIEEANRHHGVFHEIQATLIKP